LKKYKYSVPFKVLFGYLLLAGFGILTIWFIYNKVIELNVSDQPDESNQKMALISEAATRLYTAEGISRNIIQNKDTIGFQEFKKSVDTISVVLDSLKVLYESEPTKAELDSISNLLILKENNLLELLEFRAKNASENYYDRVLKRLEQADYLFGSTDYKDMVKHLEPYQQKVIIDYLQYGEEVGADRLTNRSAEELINTTKQVLLSLEMQEHQYQKSIAEKESNLLANDIKISDRLRRIRTKIEQEEIQKSIERIESGQEAMNQTYTIMIVFGVACLITILIFGFMIIRDTNKSRLYRKELEEAKVYAEQLLSSREQIMATVTHDLRSPLNSILGYADLMSKTELNSKQNNYLNQLRKSSDFTLKLINDLLDLSKLESGKINIDHLPFVPAQLIEDVVSSIIPSPDPKDLKVHIVSDEKLQENFISDPFRLQQILQNIIGNAYKFTDSGYILVQADLLDQPDGKNLQITIEDSGIGISEEKLKFIFEEFSQAESGTEKKYGGFGLGLTISKKMIELLKGSIEVKSELGKGTQFILTLPVKATKGIAGIESEKTGEREDPSKKRILVVDDDTAQQDLLYEILKNQEFKVTLADNGLQALKKLKKKNFDLVLTDIQMPEMDGFKLLQKVKNSKKTKNLPVIALSGMTDKSLQEYLEMGFSDYLLKPYSANALLKSVSKILNVKISFLENNFPSGEKVESQLYNLQELKVFTGEDDQALHNILQSLMESIEDNIEVLKRALEEKDKETIRLTAHKMLPMLRQIKAERLVEVLEILESHKNLKWSEFDFLIKKTKAFSKEILYAFKFEMEKGQV